MKKRSENRGFTLVEIIIAVAILAIAISPLVANFIQSSKLNLKGRKSLNAMNLAQDMMEGMSGYTAEEVSGLIDGAVVSGNSLAGTILPSLATHSSVTKTSPAADKKLVYKLSSVKAAPGSNEAYDVSVTLDPTGTEHAAFNGKDMADISEVDQYYDAVYTCPVSEVGDAIVELHAQSNGSKQKDEFKGKIIRTIKIEISKVEEALTSKYKYSVNVYREYKVTDSGDFATDTDLAGISWAAPVTTIIRSDIYQKPRSVYLYYEGIEGATLTAPTRLDNIEIVSTIEEEITVYLVQQAGATYDPNYACNVKITSKDMTGVIDRQDVHIVSNIRYDLSQPFMDYNFRDKKEDGTAIDPALIQYPLTQAGRQKKLEDIEASDYVTSSTYNKARANYYYNSDIQMIDETLYQSNFTAGYAKEEKNTLYKVLIDVYDGAEKIASYNGGLSN